MIGIIAIVAIYSWDKYQAYRQCIPNRTIKSIANPRIIFLYIDMILKIWKKLLEFVISKTSYYVMHAEFLRGFFHPGF